jgi:hypothetical protein
MTEPSRAGIDPLISEMRPHLANLLRGFSIMMVSQLDVALEAAATHEEGPATSNEQLSMAAHLVAVQAMAIVGRLRNRATELEGGTTVISDQHLLDIVLDQVRLRVLVLMLDPDELVAALRELME